MTDLLLKYGARVDDCKALCVATKLSHVTLTARLLSIKALPDPECKINKKAIPEKNVFSDQLAMLFNIRLTDSSILPNVPTMINWHNQKCHLTQILPEWLTDAALHVNPKLKQNPQYHDIALIAITHLDKCNNSLTSLPITVFQLPSVRYLNTAQIKIERIPVPETTSRSKRGSIPGLSRRNRKLDNSKLKYDSPVLKEIYLQDNRLELISKLRFGIPVLVTLVVSNNKLQFLPHECVPKLNTPLKHPDRNSNCFIFEFTKTRNLISFSNIP